MAAKADSLKGQACLELYKDPFPLYTNTETQYELTITITLAYALRFISIIAFIVGVFISG